MINLRVKIDSNGNTFNFRHELEDDFVIAKENLSLQKIVEIDCEESHCKEIDDVTLYVKWDW
jgi:hypothetical protein